MDFKLKIFLFSVVLIFFALIFLLLKKNKLKVKYSVLWITMSVIFLIVLVFSETVKKISALAGFETTSNFVFFLAIFFILIMLVSLCIIISKQSEQIKKLTQRLGILNNKLDKFEGKTNGSKDEQYKR